MVAVLIGVLLDMVVVGIVIGVLVGDGVVRDEGEGGGEDVLGGSSVIETGINVGVVVVLMLVDVVEGV